MKLTIRSDIIAILKQLLKQDYEHKLRFLFGKMFRTGFVPYLNRWDHQCVKKALESRYSATRTRVGTRSYTELCDIGFVTDRRVILSEVKEEEGDDIAITAFHIGKYDVVLVRSQRDYQVEIELTHQPSTVKDLFDPVKFVYGLFTQSVQNVTETKSVIEEYNILFKRTQDTPWIVPQGLRFLDEKQLVTMRDYVVMPMRRGEKYMLFLSHSGAYLLSKREILLVDRDVPSSLYNTVVSGDWYENTFTAYDIARIGDNDVRRKSLLQRVKHLRVVSVRFPFCEMVRYYRGNLGKHTEELLLEHEGVIFAPIHANYMNDRVFLYQPVENVGIKFKLDERVKCGFHTFALKTGVNENLFTGVDKLPYEPFIPLSKEDRDFIGPLNNTVFEFRWESDGLMPYVHAYENESTTSKFAQQAWVYINDPLDKDLVISSLRTFKKESSYAKEKLAMAKQLGKLKQLPVNKTVVFWSPIEGDDVLVRTGTIAEGSCFVAGTNVYTLGGSKPIETVEIGDQVVTHTGKVQKVVQLHKNELGNRRIHDLEVYKTPLIHVTGNHPFFVVKRIGKEYSKPDWVEARDLDCNCYVMIPNNTQSASVQSIKVIDNHENLSSDDYIEIDDKVQSKNADPLSNQSISQPCNKEWKVDEDFCFLLGLWFGDGCVHSVKRNNTYFPKGVSFVASTRNFKVTDFVASYGEKVFGISPCIYINDKQNTITVTFNNVIIAETFINMFGKGFDGKRVPEFMHNIDTHLIKSFIAGLITTDGCVDTKLNISLCMTNPTFINELYHLARAHGLDCSATYRPNQSGKQTGWMRFSRSSVLVEKLMKHYSDNRMERLLEKTTEEGNTGFTLRMNGNTYLRVISNKVTSKSPDYVYTLGIENDHSYSVEGLIAKNCFFHSLLHAYSKEYASMDRRGRMKFVRRLRASMAGKIDRESWEEMGGGLIAKIPFQENVNDILVNFYRYLSNDSQVRGRGTRRVIKSLVGEDQQQLELYQLVSELIPIDTGFEQNILPTAYSNTDEAKIAECCDAIIDETLNFLNDKEELKSVSAKKAEYIHGVVSKFLTEVLKEAEGAAFKDYVSGLQNVAEDVDTYTIGLISDRFKRDIYFLDGKNRMPYNNSSTTDNLKGRKSMIVLWIGGNHYEIVGRLLPGNRIQREFSHNDPIIKKLYTFLVKPEEIPETFPDLVPYLPREYRNSTSPSPRRFSDSEDEDDRSESDRYYDSDSDYGSGASDRE
jgi:hypothetical protein